jgi:DNA-binding transcriptional ArsR family regulator
MKTTKTGHPVVDAVDQLFSFVKEANLTFAHFPDNWLHKITTKSHEPDWSACRVLGEICYFYRSGTKVIDGQIVPCKKFAADLWHLCVTDLAEKLNLTPRAVRYALERLEGAKLKPKLIKCHPRFDGPTGKKGRYLYIELFVDKIAEITFLKPDQRKYISSLGEAHFPTKGSTLPHQRKPTSYQNKDSVTKTPKEKTNKQKKTFVRYRPSDSSQGATPSEPPAGRRPDREADEKAKPEPKAAPKVQSDKSKDFSGVKAKAPTPKAAGMEYAGLIKQKQAELDRLKEERDRLKSNLSEVLDLPEGEESDELYRQTTNQQREVEEQMSALRAAIVELQVKSKAAKEEEEERAMKAEMLTPEFQAKQLAKVMEYAPKLHQAHFGETLPDYDRRRVAEVLAQLSEEGWYQPAMQFIGRLALSWRRIGTQGRNGYVYKNCLSSRSLDQFCLKFEKICAHDISENLGDRRGDDRLFGLSDPEKMADWLLDQYDDVDGLDELCSEEAL